MSTDRLAVLPKLTEKTGLVEGTKDYIDYGAKIEGYAEGTTKI